MITLRAVAIDDQPPSVAEPAVSAPLPVGVRDGDLLLAAVSVYAANVSITPPAGWTLVLQTDPTLGCSVSVFSRTALCERARWVFGLSPAASADLIVASYSGVDGFAPTEFAVPAASGGASCPIAALSTSLPDEEVCVFAAAAKTGGFTAGSIYAPLAQVQVNAGSLALANLNASVPGPIAADALPIIGGAASSASVALVLRPTAGTLTTDDTRGVFLGGFPKGVERVYDLEPDGDYYNLLQASAQITKEVVFDLIDTLRREANPRTAVTALPAWENLLGLARSIASQTGAVPQRRAQVIASLRAAVGAGCTRDVITAVIGPLLGYLPSTPVQVITTDPNLLAIANSYSPENPIVVPPGGSADYLFTPHDGGVVDRSGARVQLEWGAVSGPLGPTIAVTLTNGPYGGGIYSHAWTVAYNGQALDWLWAPDAAGQLLTGTWQLHIASSLGVAVDIIPTVYIAGVAPGQRTASAIFDWGVYADPVHLGENGTPANFGAARDALAKLRFVYTQVHLLQSLVPYPDVVSGTHAAIPDECIPI